MPHPCIGFEIGSGHTCWYFRAYICSKILKVLHPCIGFGIGLGHIWGHANAWIWYIYAYAWILYIHVLSNVSHILKAEIFGFMFQYLSSERMGLRFWANPIHNTWLDHGEISRTRCTPFCPVMPGIKRMCCNKTILFRRIALIIELQFTERINKTAAVLLHLQSLHTREYLDVQSFL